MYVANLIEEGRLGGPQVRVAKVAKRLEEYEVSTIVIYPRLDSDRFANRLKKLNVNYKEVYIHRLTRQISVLLMYVLMFPYEVYNIKCILREEGVDVVHVNGSWQVKGILAAWLEGVTAVWHLNDTHIPVIVRVVFLCLAQFGVDGFILASQRTKDYYVNGTNLSSLPSCVIQAPVDIHEFDPATVEPSPIISSLDGLKVVTVSSINPIKGIETFIDMAENVCDRVPAVVHFIIVGPIHDSQQRYGHRLRSRAEDSTSNIYFTGHSDKVPQILKAADLYVCSSKSEASPMSVWEAMAMRLPVVSTDVGDVRQFLEDDTLPAGAVVEVGDSTALTDEVLRFLNDSNLRRKAGRNGRQVACSQLDLNTCAKKHHEFYRRVLCESD